MEHDEDAAIQAVERKRDLLTAYRQDGGQSRPHRLLWVPGGKQAASYAAYCSSCQPDARPSPALPTHITDDGVFRVLCKTEVGRSRIVGHDTERRSLALLDSTQLHYVWQHSGRDDHACTHQVL